MPGCKERECPEEEISSHEEETSSFSFNYHNTCQKFGSECGSPDNYKVLGIKADAPYPACIPPRNPLDVQGSSANGLTANTCSDKTQVYSSVRNACVYSPSLTADSSIG